MKALIGSWENRPYRLLAENTALRARVAELQKALANVSKENDALRAALGDVDPVGVEHVDELEVVVSQGALR